MRAAPSRKLVLCFALATGLGIGIFLIGKIPPAETGSTASQPEVISSSETPLPRKEQPRDASPDLPLPRLEGANEEQLSPSEALAESLRRLDENPGVVPGELLLQFRFASDIAALRTRAPGLGINVIWSDARLNSARIAFTDADSLAKELLSNEEIYEGIGPNYLMAVPGLPPPPEPEIDTENPGGTAPFEDTFLAWIGADQDRSRWGDGVTVAILDSGIEDHPTLENTAITQVTLSSPDDIHGHGTAMASLVAGRLAPAEGIAPAAALLDVRVTDEAGISNTGLVAEAILSATDKNVDVINISLGAVGHSPVLESAIRYARERNVIVVAAAGNEQTTQLAYPAAYDGVISVGAVDAGNTQAYFSNSGETLTISAPGVGIVSAYSDEALVLGSGTSQAAAITSGVVAALLSQGHQASEILGILEKNAVPTGAPRTQVGAGVIRMP